MPAGATAPARNAGCIRTERMTDTAIAGMNSATAIRVDRVAWRSASKFTPVWGMRRPSMRSLRSLIHATNGRRDSRAEKNRSCERSV